jgi:hypothetical protein
MAIDLSHDCQQAQAYALANFPIQNEEFVEEEEPW